MFGFYDFNYPSKLNLKACNFFFFNCCVIFHKKSGPDICTADYKTLQMIFVNFILNIIEVKEEANEGL